MANFMTNKSNHQTWYIVGHGAIGLLWASALSCNNRVTLILRDSSSSSALRYTFTDIKGQQKQQTLDITSKENLSREQITIDKLLIPTKAYDILPAVKQLQPFLSETCIILLCHNGLGTIEKVQALLKPKQSLYFATTTHGAYKSNKHSVVHTGLGETKIGLIQGKDSQIEAQDLLPPFSWQKNITVTLWNKLAINCAINPLTAIHNCKNGQLERSEYRTPLTEICQEFCLVANLVLKSEVFNSQQILNRCLEVIKATANNFSSMHQDVKHGRPSEIDFITGFIISKAQEFDLSVPTHQLIYRQFMDISSKHQ